MYGVIGVKVWIFRDKENERPAQSTRPGRGRQDRSRQDRGQETSRERG